MRKQSGKQLEFEHLQYLLSEADPESWEEFVDMLPASSRKLISELFSAEFALYEIERMLFWYSVHPDKKPKTVRHWALAGLSWLDKTSKQKNEGRVINKLMSLGDSDE